MKEELHVWGISKSGIVKVDTILILTTRVVTVDSNQPLKRDKRDVFCAAGSVEKHTAHWHCTLAGFHFAKPHTLMAKGNWTLQNAEHFVRLKISTVKAQ